MKTACISILLICGTATALEGEYLAKTGDTVVVYAEIVGCPDFPGIIAFDKVAPDSKLTLLSNLPGLRSGFVAGVNPVDSYLRTAVQIRSTLVEEISRRRDDASSPKSLRVVILRTEQEARLLQDQVLASFEYLATSRCLHPRKYRKPIFERQREILEATLHRIG